MHEMMRGGKTVAKRQTHPSRIAEFLRQMRQRRQLQVIALFLSMVALLPFMLGLKRIAFLVFLLSYGVMGAWFVRWLKDVKRHAAKADWRACYQQGGGLQGWDVLYIFVILHGIVLFKAMPGLQVTNDIFFLIGFLAMAGCGVAAASVCALWVQLGYRWLLLLLFSFAFFLSFMGHVNYSFPIRQQQFEARVVTESAWQTPRKQQVFAQIMLKSEKEKWTEQVSHITLERLKEGDTVLVTEYQGPLWIRWRQVHWPTE